jgi:hypothetical protein
MVLQVFDIDGKLEGGIVYLKPILDSSDFIDIKIMRITGFFESKFYRTSIRCEQQNWIGWKRIYV